jgi:hypothetical protein
MRWLLKRWWFWTGAGFILVAIAAGYFVIPIGEDRISQATCDRIQLGMKYEEVKSLLGNDLPCMFPGSRTRTAYIFYHAASLSGPHDVSWFDDEGNEILLVFEGGSRDPSVASKGFRRAKLPLYERIKRRIERRIPALWP